MITKIPKEKMINGANQCEKLCKNFSAISDKRILKRIEKKLRVKK